MLHILITYLNSRLATTGYINKILCLAEKIEREGKVFPAQYVKNEFKRIDLDAKGSVSYWRKNGAVTYSQNENTTKVGQIEFVTNVPLKFVGFVKKDSALNDAYFADNMVEALKSIFSTNTAILNSALKAKKTSIVAVRYDTDGRSVANEEYDNIDYEPRYTHAYFSIDIEIKITSNQNCYNDICDADWTAPTPTELVSFCTRVENCQLLFQQIELDSGVIDGVNKVFVWAHDPIQVFVNGQLKQLNVGYTISGDTITLTDAPFADENICAFGNY